MNHGKLEELMSFILSGPIGQDIKDTACENVRRDIPKMMKIFQEKCQKHNQTPVQQISVCGRIVNKWQEKDIQPAALDHIMEAFFSMALYASINNKTMPEAMEVYCQMLQETN